MKILTSFIPFFILFLQNELSEAIIDGKRACKAEFPFQVSFQKITQSNKHFCGGTIIHEKFVLTAAHCVAGLPMEETRLVAGVANLKDKLTDDNIRLIAQQYRHIRYNRPLPKDNDIALVKVTVAWKLDKNIGKAILPPATFQVPVNQIVYATGWDVEKTDTTTTPSTLKKTKVQVLDHAECVKRYTDKLKIAATLLCTVHKGSKNKGICNGDSGGPITINKKDLVGVIAGTYRFNECGANETPDLHSEVAKYRVWIDKTIHDNP